MTPPLTPRQRAEKLSIDYAREIKGIPPLAIDLIHLVEQAIADAIQAERAKVEFAEKALNEIWTMTTPSRRGYFRKGVLNQVIEKACYAVGRLESWDHVACLSSDAAIRARAEVQKKETR